ncbi:hypothetical protein G9P44_002348 [Scheffersomyces stipitis]|nr:hypothetical protein G9P44_002348 [Scheffersomyces stipitis]
MFRRLNPVSSKLALECYHEPSSATPNDDLLPSFSSLIVDHPSVSGRSEILGFRRIARACSRPLNLFGETKNLDLASELQVQVTSNANQEVVVQIPQEQIPNPDSEASKTPTTISRKKFNKTLRKTKPSLENISKHDKLSKPHSRNISRRSQENNSQRVVVISGIPHNTEVNSILAQVCGGPLERLVYKDNSALELFFIFPEQANQFYKYVNGSGLFIVNGKPLKVEWADKSNTEDYTGLHSPIPKSLMNDVVYYGSRRILIFAKFIPNKKLKSGTKMFYPDPEIHFSTDLNIAQIKQDFAKFGSIIEVGPVISRKLCFSLHFTDIRSAILAKSECELEGSAIHQKYGSWIIWYGRDTTDKPCYVI